MSLASIVAWSVFSVLLAYTVRRFKINDWRKKAKYASWHRQRWAIQMFNGRHNLDFGYYLHRGLS